MEPDMRVSGLKINSMVLVQKLGPIKRNIMVVIKMDERRV
jgi:hypothetical protein